MPAGRITRLSVTFTGTNSPVDLPDYTQLNSGEIAPRFEPLLAAVRAYALAHDVTADHVLVTGYSLGAAYTNIMAKYADTLAGGFFATAIISRTRYPIPSRQDRVLNIGYENDVVHRAAWISHVRRCGRACPRLAGAGLRPRLLDRQSDPVQRRLRQPIVAGGPLRIVQSHRRMERPYRRHRLGRDPAHHAFRLL